MILFLTIMILISLLVGFFLNRVIVNFCKKISVTKLEQDFVLDQRLQVVCITLLFSLITAIHFEFCFSLVAALFFTWILITLSFIDGKTEFLPDDLTLPGLWLGLIINIHGTFCDLQSAVLGAIIGYMLLWSIFWIYQFMTHKEAMGYGDFKLLAMLGAFLGWQALPSIILIASMLGTLTGVFLLYYKKRYLSQPMAFGPFLAFSGWITLITKNSIPPFFLS